MARAEHVRLARPYGARVLEPTTADALPGAARRSVEAAEEVVYWLPGARAVVPGDTLLGTDDGVTLCPASWLEERGGSRRLARDLAPLLELPVERVLPSHGPPLLADGRTRARARALAAV